MAGKQENVCNSRMRRSGNTHTQHTQRLVQSREANSLESLQYREVDLRSIGTLVVSRKELITMVCTLAAMWRTVLFVRPNC